MLNNVILKLFPTIILLLLFNKVSGQCNYLIIKWNPPSCDELFQGNESYSLKGVYSKFIKEKYFDQTKFMVWVTEDTSRDFYNELTEFDNYIPTNFSENSIKIIDTTNKFSMEFVTGFNDIENKYIRIYGVVNCILFLDRVIQKLLVVNPMSSMIQTLKIKQEILLYDRLCKCDYP